MRRRIVAAALILGGMLNAAQADTWVFRDTLRPGGHDRGMAAKRADGRKCGTVRGSFKDGSGFEPCMAARGWVLDHVIPDPPSTYARNSRHGGGPSVDNSSNDDSVQRQRDQDNTQQMLNTQQMINDQQMQNDQSFQQQQQQMINDMNNH
jgi:hypothetical protein